MRILTEPLSSFVNVSATEQRLVGLRFLPVGEREVDVLVEGPFGSAAALRRGPDLSVPARHLAEHMPGATPEALRAWWNGRHPAARIPAGTADVPAMRTWIGNALATGLNQQWFTDNYRIVIGDPETGPARLPAAPSCT